MKLIAMLSSYIHANLQKSKVLIGIIILLIMNTFDSNGAAIDVYVHNANGSIVSGAMVILYDSNWDSISTKYSN